MPENKQLNSILFNQIFTLKKKKRKISSKFNTFGSEI